MSKSVKFLKSQVNEYGNLKLEGNKIPSGWVAVPQKANQVKASGIKHYFKFFTGWAVGGGFKNAMTTTIIRKQDLIKLEAYLASKSK